MYTTTNNRQTTTFGHIELLSAAIKQNIEMIYLLLFMTASSDLLSRQSEPRRRAAGLLRVGARGRLLAGHDRRGVQDEGRYTVELPTNVHDFFIKLGPGALSL